MNNYPKHLSLGCCLVYPCVICNCLIINVYIARNETFVKVSKAGERPAPKDYDPSDEESGFAPLEVSEEEFEREPMSALEEYLDPSTPESRRSVLAKELQDAGYDIQ